MKRRYYRATTPSTTRVHVRCRKCETRRVLPRALSTYNTTPSKGNTADQPPMCRCCGKRDYRADRWMNSRNTSGTRCDCAAYHFPHRMSSLYCHYRKDGSGRYPGDADFADRNYFTEQNHKRTYPCSHVCEPFFPEVSPSQQPLSLSVFRSYRESSEAPTLKSAA
jgi:hypothetical protein